MLASRHQHTHDFNPSQSLSWQRSRPKQHKDRPSRPQRDLGSQNQAELLLNSEPEASGPVFPSIGRGKFPSLAATQLPAQEEPHFSISLCSGVIFPPSLARLLGNPDSGVFFPH